MLTVDRHLIDIARHGECLYIDGRRYYMRESERAGFNFMLHT